MATYYHGSSFPLFPPITRSFFGIKSDPVVHSISTSQEGKLEAFQKEVTQMFYDLSLVESDELLSFSWISKLLDVFLRCQEQFRVILLDNKLSLTQQPLERWISDYFEWSVKGLDICNATKDGIEQMRQWKNRLEIVLSVLENPKIRGEAQIQRVKRAFKKLEIKIIDGKEAISNLRQGNRSFNLKKLRHQQSKSLKLSNSLSWSDTKSWSASKKLQAIRNIVVPKRSESIATNGLVLAVYTMSHVLNFVMWALVAAIPCQGRWLQSHFIISKNLTWSVHIISLQERILEISKKRDRRNTCGLLKEIHGIEMYACHMNGFIDSIQFPLGDELEDRLTKIFEDSLFVYESLKNGLNQMEKQVREVFHRIVRCIIEGLDFVAQTT